MYLAVLWICDSVLDAELGNDISVEFHKKFFFRKKRKRKRKNREIVKVQKFRNDP